MNKTLPSILGALVMLGAGLWIVNPKPAPPPPPPPVSAADLRAQRVLAQFDQLTGAHRNLEALAKSAMHDPASYEHVETRYQDRGAYIFLRTKYRGTNAYGVKVIAEAMARADLDGKVVEVETIKP
jgi:hypothetical protein